MLVGACLRRIRHRLPMRTRYTTTAIAEAATSRLKGIWSLRSSSDATSPRFAMLIDDADTVFVSVNDRQLIPLRSFRLRIPDFYASHDPASGALEGLHPKRRLPSVRSRGRDPFIMWIRTHSPARQ